MRQHDLITPTEKEIPSHPSHCFFSSEEVRSFPELLKKPYKHFIEMREYLYLGKVLQFIRDEYPHVSMSLTTSTAFRQPVADFFTTHISSQCDFSAELMADIKTCLQEAVMNSIIHGNLCIAHEKPEDFHLYLENISQTANRSEAGLKRVSIFAWITDQHVTLCVSDQGKGFVIEPQEQVASSPYGRGLSLISHMCARTWHTQPSNFYMQFNRHG